MQQQVACWKEESKIYTLTFAQMSNCFDKWHVFVIHSICEKHFVVARWPKYLRYKRGGRFKTPLRPDFGTNFKES